MSLIKNVCILFNVHGAFQDKPSSYTLTKLKDAKRNNSKSLGAKNHSALTKQQTNFGYNVSSPRHDSGG
jgi:hypothetical protein